MQLSSLDGMYLSDNENSKLNPKIFESHSLETFAEHVSCLVLDKAFNQSESAFFEPIMER